MAIQKFKYGQEITSAKLNEIVGFINDLEAFLNNGQTWTNTIDQKITGFQNQLTAILNQIKGLLETSESYDVIIDAYADLKAKYESLVANNVEALLENLFSAENITSDTNGIIIINGVNTGIQLTSVPGPTGAAGANGLNGSNGLDGATILTGATTPQNNLGKNTDLYIRTTDFALYRKASGVWNQLTTTLKGATGTIGATGATTLIEFKYKTNESDSLQDNPSPSTKFLYFKTYLSTDNDVKRNATPWNIIKIRGDSWYPVITRSGSEVLLSWTTTENVVNSAVNIKGDKGDNGTSVSIKGSFEDYTDLEDVTTPVLGDSYLIDGDLWVYTNQANTGTPPAEGSAYEGFLNVGTIQGPTGPAGPAGATGSQGVRGSKFFVIETTFPTATPWNSIALIVGDIFLDELSGTIKQVTALSPFTLEDVYKIPFDNELIIRAKASENITKGNVLQFNGVEDGLKLTKKANATEIIDDPSLIMGVAKTTVTSGNLIDVIVFGKITGITGFSTTSPTLYYNSTTSTPGLITATQPNSRIYPVIIVGYYLGGSSDTVQVKIRPTYNYDQIAQLENEFSTKADISNPVFQSSVQLPIETSIGPVSSGEISYLNNVTAPIQTQLNAKQATVTGGATTIVSSNLTASRALASDTSGKVVVSAVTASELGHVSGVTSPIQTQFGTKANIAGPTFTGTVSAPTPATTSNTTTVATTAFVKNNIQIEELLSGGTAISVSAGGSESATLTQELSVGKDCKIKVFWKINDLDNVSYCSEFSLNSKNVTMVASAQGWNEDTSRLEFYSLNIQSTGIFGQDKTKTLTFKNAKKWHLDGSFANSDDISNVAVTITSVTRSYTTEQGNT